MKKLEDTTSTVVSRHMRENGWELTETGGGCTAWWYKRKFGHLLITESHGANAPQNFEDDCTIGIYNSSGHAFNNESCVYTVKGLLNAIDLGLHWEMWNQLLIEDEMQHQEDQLDIIASNALNNALGNIEKALGTIQNITWLNDHQKAAEADQTNGELLMALFKEYAQTNDL